MDPTTTSDGKPYRDKRFKELIKECWFITDQLHTSYAEALDMSTFERITLIKLINEKMEATNKAMEESAKNAKNRKNKR